MDQVPAPPPAFNPAGRVVNGVAYTPSRLLEMQREYEAQLKDSEEKKPGLITRAIRGVQDINVWDALHPQGTGSTKRGFTDIYPKP